jgi:hypothetical protein
MAFDNLLLAKIDNPSQYETKYNEFLIYSGKMQQYYYTNVAVPSEHYDEKVLTEISNHLLGGLNE